MEFFQIIWNLLKSCPCSKKGTNALLINIALFQYCFLSEKFIEKQSVVDFKRFFEKHSIVISAEYGFPPYRSTSHALLNIISQIYTSINNKNYTGLIFLDSTKAFNTVCHDRLLLNLEHYGIRENALNVLASYLLDRMQYDFIQNSSSSLHPITAGVPQGSILGPLLLLV